MTFVSSKGWNRHHSSYLCPLWRFLRTIRWRFSVLRPAKREARLSLPWWVVLPCRRSSKLDEKMRDNGDYRAANGRAQPAASGLLSGFRRTENRSLQRFVRSGAARELPAVPVTALSNVAVSPTANRLVSIPMVFIPIHCNGPRHAMDLVMEWTSSWNGPRHGMHWYAMDSNALNTNAFHDVPSGRRPGEKDAEARGLFTTILVTSQILRR